MAYFQFANRSNHRFKTYCDNLQEIMNQQAKVDAINEAFEEMKRQSEQDRKKRMEQF